MAVKSRYLKVTWSYSDEYISVEAVQAAARGEKIATIEKWTHEPSTQKRIVDYEAVLTSVPAGRRLSFSLHYDPNAQRNALVIEHEKELYWGEFHFDIDLERKVGVAWQSGDERPTEGQADNVEVLESIDDERLMTIVKRAARPDQARIRAELLALSGSACVVAGSCHPATLDLAHIVEVRTKGIDRHDNCLLLRTDLHRLMDAGLMRFEIHDGGAVVKFDDLVRQHYSQWHGKPLADNEFNRVKLALRKRFVQG